MLSQLKARSLSLISNLSRAHEHTVQASKRVIFPVCLFPTPACFRSLASFLLSCAESTMSSRLNAASWRGESYHILKPVLCRAFRLYCEIRSKQGKRESDWPARLFLCFMVHMPPVQNQRTPLPLLHLLLRDLATTACRPAVWLPVVTQAGSRRPVSPPCRRGACGSSRKHVHGRCWGSGRRCHRRWCSGPP